METDEDEFESKKPRKTSSRNKNLLSRHLPTKRKTVHKLILKYLVFFISLIFAAALVGVLTKHDFLPYFTEHARELSKHRARGEEVKFHSVYNIEKFPHKDLQLPKDLKPLNYKLDLRVNLTTLKYSGVVKIQIVCNKATRYVILHCGDLDVLNVSVKRAENSREKRILIERILVFKEYQQLCIELRDALHTGEVYYVSLEFKSKISDRLEGFYKSSYTTETGVKRTLAVSHFEPAHARKVFPCFDEPSFKASFTISITHDPQYYALSNMPRIRLVSKKDGLVEEHFAPSVNMSSYLVAFAVVDFKYKEKKTGSGVLVRVHAPPDDHDRLEYALETGVKVLSYYEKLFGEPFPLPKLDMLAVPDFLIGAMEEWGLVMFRRSYLVYDEEFCSTDVKLAMTKVIAHELAHQWFGNLVTMRWWNDLWLNEGFAIFVEDEFGANHVLDGWNVREPVVSTSWQSALQADSAWSSHPISVKVQRPEEIDDIFDAISYQKGAMILRMLMNFLGEEKFLDGIKRYIQTFKYGNADAEELWDAIGEANGNINVKGLMKVWTDQTGFPIVNIRKQGDVFHVEQEDVLEELERGNKKSENRQKWSIPMSYVTQSHQTPRWVSISPTYKSYPLKGASTNGWIMANINATGFFMVNYDEENWKKLTAQLREDHQVFSPSDRAGLLHDVFSLSCRGLLDPVLTLNLSTYLTQEQHPVPWSVARHVSKCLTGVFSKPHKPLYKQFLWHLQDHLIDLVGAEDTGTDQERYFRYDVLSEAMKSGQRKDVNERFVRLFNELKNTSLGSLPSVGANFRNLAFSFGVNKSSEGDWDYLWSVYQHSPFDTDRKFLMNVITSFNTDGLRSRMKGHGSEGLRINQGFLLTIGFLNRNLLYSLDENKVRPQDSLYWIEMVNKGSGKTDSTWDFIVKHWKNIARRYGGSYKLGNLVKAVAGGFHTTDQLKMVERLFHSLTPGEIAVRAQSKTLEKIQSNIAGKPAQLKTSEARMVKWIKEYNRSS